MLAMKYLFDILLQHGVWFLFIYFDVCVPCYCDHVCVIWKTARKREWTIKQNRGSVAGQRAKQSADKSQAEFLMQSPLGCSCCRGGTEMFVFLVFLVPSLKASIVTALYLLRLFVVSCGVKDVTFSQAPLLICFFPDIYRWWFVFLGFKVASLWPVLSATVHTNLCFLCSLVKILKSFFSDLPPSPADVSLLFSLFGPLFSLIS